VPWLLLCCAVTATLVQHNNERVQKTPAVAERCRCLTSTSN
jgi:hypothetical protein